MTKALITFLEVAKIYDQRGNSNALSVSVAWLTEASPLMLLSLKKGMFIACRRNLRKVIIIRGNSD
uniref:Uncharacterized protein n=1 Tax=Octopus bimaculoides TaxID=37653 RepID=A0A0L8GJ87_OCTBM